MKVGQTVTHRYIDCNKRIARQTATIIEVRANHVVIEQNGIRITVPVTRIEV